MKKGRIKVMLGNEACAEAALLAGCRFYAGYPITPATEILEVMSRRLPLVDGLCLQMEDEIAAVVAVVGASWGGTKAMTATSGPGFCLMQEGDRSGRRGRSPLRHRQRAAGRARIGPVHLDRPGGFLPGEVRFQRGLFHHRPVPFHGPGDVRPYDQGLQPLGAVPDPGHHPFR